MPAVLVWVDVSPALGVLFERGAGPSDSRPALSAGAAPSGSGLFLSLWRTIFNGAGAMAKRVGFFAGSDCCCSLRRCRYGSSAFAALMRSCRSIASDCVTVSRNSGS